MSSVAKFVDINLIRDRFSKAMSVMYQKEVPAYKTLLDLVAEVNEKSLSNYSTNEIQSFVDSVSRLECERHGAIRLGKAEELNNIRRMFALMGMYPVGYYDLSVAGIPVHSTAFRPVDAESLAINPFRVFTSLLRLELIKDEALREKAKAVLAERQIFSERLQQLIDKGEAQGGLDKTETEVFIEEAVLVFKWHDKALVDETLYKALFDSHQLVADVVSFKSPHINHLTPRTLDIDEVQQQMPVKGIDPKLVIEGPPRRDCPILLRQTSFKAIVEPVKFLNDKGEYIDAFHTARFGEIEQRGVALTPKGRALYDKLLNAVLGKVRLKKDGSNLAEYKTVLMSEFAAFPDDYQTLYEKGLAYFSYHKKPGTTIHVNADKAALLKSGEITISPITYEDFLPVSAAGIFRSNLTDDKNEQYGANANQQQFEQALGREVIDPFVLYQAIADKSWLALI